MAQAARLRRPRPRIPAAPAATLALLLGAAPAPAADWTVEVFLTGYRPEALTVTAGDTITWVNRSPVPHEMAFTGDPTGGGADYTAPVLLKTPVSLTVTRPGKYPYRCNWHGFYGLLTVRPRAD